MELLSAEFVKLVTSLFEQNSTNIIATIPMPKGKPIPFVESLKNKSDSSIYIVTKNNRNTIDSEIMSIIEGG